jgi:hypothetical protein
MATSFSGGGIRSTQREPPTMGKQAAASDKVNQLLAHGRWFSSGIPASSSTTKTGRHDIAEILLKVALNTNNQIKSIYGIIRLFLFYRTSVYIMYYFKLIIRLFLDNRNGIYIMCFCVVNP